MKTVTEITTKNFQVKTENTEYIKVENKMESKTKERTFVKWVYNSIDFDFMIISGMLADNSEQE